MGEPGKRGCARPWQAQAPGSSPQKWVPNGPDQRNDIMSNRRENIMRVLLTTACKTSAILILISSLLLLPARILLAATRQQGSPTPLEILPPLEKSIPLNGAYVARSGSLWVPWVAKEAGFFEKYGLTGKLDFVAMASRPIEAMMTGTFQFLAIAGPTVAMANLSGLDIVMVAGLVNKPHMSILVKSTIKTPEELRGKKLGTDQRSSSMFFLMSRAIRHWGMDPDKDVSMWSLGVGENLFAGLSAGQIDGAIFSEPLRTIALKAGFRELAKLSELGIKTQSVTIATSQKLINSNPEAVRRLVAAVSEGAHRLKQDKAFAIQVMTKYTRLDDPSVLQGLYEVFAPLMEEVPFPTAEGIKADLQDLCATGQTPGACQAQPERFFNLQFVRELQEAGFYKALAAR